MDQGSVLPILSSMDKKGIGEIWMRQYYYGPRDGIKRVCTAQKPEKLGKHNATGLKGMLMTACSNVSCAFKPVPGVRLATVKSSASKFIARCDSVETMGVHLALTFRDKRAYDKERWVLNPSLDYEHNPLRHALNTQTELRYHHYKTNEHCAVCGTPDCMTQAEMDENIKPQDADILARFGAPLMKSLLAAYAFLPWSCC